MKTNKIQFTLTILFFLGISQPGFSQTKELKITYSQNVHITEGPNHKTTIEIRATGKELINKTISEVKVAKPIRDESGNFVKLDNYTKETYSWLFKDYTKNTLSYGRSDFPDKVIVEELKLFSWNLSDKTDTILGYPCRAAEAEFRGRKYLAFFTTEIPFRAAPWKFHGLPGVMLKVESEDGFIKMEANSLSIINQEDEIENPFANKKEASYEQLVEHLKKQRKEHIEKVKRLNALRDGPKGRVGDPVSIEIIEYENPQ